MPTTFFRALALSFTGVLALVVTGCDGDDPALAQSQYIGGVYGNTPVSSSAPQDSVSYWDGDGVSGKPSIKIKLGEQRAYFYKGGQLVGVSQLSTGREGLITPSGHFSIIQKDQAHVSTKYGDYVDSGGQRRRPECRRGKDPKPPGTHFKGAPMPYFMRIVGGVGMHAGYLPGYPGFAWLHPDAGVHGGEFLPVRLPPGRRVSISRARRGQRSPCSRLALRVSPET